MKGLRREEPTSERRRILKRFYEEQSQQDQWNYLHFGFGKNIHKVRLERSLSYLDLGKTHTPNAFIIDLGCGDGVFTVEIAKRSEGTVIGCDISKNRIHKLKKALRKLDLRKKSDSVICDAAHLPFRERSIQKIFCHHLLEHVPEDDVVIQEIATVLQINGKLVIGVPNENSVLSKVRKTLWSSRLWKLLGIGCWSGHINRYSFQSLQDKLRKNGLKVINGCSIGLVFPFLPIHYFILSNRILFRLANSIGCQFPTLSDSLLFKAVKPSQS